MYGDFFLELMRHVHRGFDLFVAVGLEAGHVVIRSRGRVHLDHIRARGELLPDGSQNLRHTVRRSSRGWRDARLKRSERGVQAIAAHKHPRANHLPPIDQVAHGDVHVLVRPQIPHCRHTRFKRAHRSLARHENHKARIHVVHLLQHRHAERFFCVNRHVRVRVNESRQPRELRQVDHLGSRRNCPCIRRHRANALALHDDDGVAPDFSAAVPKLAKAHGLDTRRFALGRHARRCRCAGTENRDDTEKTHGEPPALRSKKSARFGDF